MTKAELLSQTEQSFAALREFLEALPPERREESGFNGVWTVKDLLVHLNFWKGECITLIFKLANGQPIPKLDSLDVDKANARFYELGKDRAWDAAWTDFLGLQRQLLRRIAEFSEEQLTTPGYYRPLGKSTLEHFISANTWEHEQEHLTALQGWLAQSR